MTRLTKTPTLSRPALSMAALAAAWTFVLCTGAEARPGSPAGDDGMIARTLQATRDRLHLDTSQQLGWDHAVAQSKAAFAALRANRQRLQAALQAELAKGEPDLAAVAAFEDQVREQNIAQRVAVRNQWLGLYATLSPEQKTIVRDSMAERMARRDALRGRTQGRHPDPGKG